MMADGQNDEGSGLPTGGIPVPMNHEHILCIFAHIYSVDISNWVRGCRSTYSTLVETSWWTGEHCWWWFSISVFHSPIHILLMSGYG